MAKNDTVSMMSDTKGWVITSREWGVYLGMQLGYGARLEDPPVEQQLWSHSPVPLTVVPDYAPVFPSLQDALEHAHDRFSEFAPGLDFKLVDADVVIPMRNGQQLVYASRAVLVRAGELDWVTADSETSNKVAS